MGRIPGDYRSALQRERTLITLAVLVAGTVLVVQFGDSGPVWAGVFSMWTLVLTFWFRSEPPNGGP